MRMLGAVAVHVQLNSAPLDAAGCRNELEGMRQVLQVQAWLDCMS